MLYDIGHGHGLAGAGHAQQRLEPVAALEASTQLIDCFGLIASGLKGSLEIETRARHSGESSGFGICSGITDHAWPLLLRCDPLASGYFVDAFNSSRRLDDLF